MSYYNTTNLEKEALKKCRKAVVSQEKKILEIFKNHQIPLSPTDIFSNFFKKTPLTSIEKDGNVIKLNFKSNTKGNA